MNRYVLYIKKLSGRIFWQIDAQNILKNIERLVALHQKSANVNNFDRLNLAVWSYTAKSAKFLLPMFCAIRYDIPTITVFTKHCTLYLYSII